MQENTKFDCGSSRDAETARVSLKYVYLFLLLGIVVSAMVILLEADEIITLVTAALARM